MVSHIVLFRPRAGLSEEERVGFVDALAAARQDIPSIRHFRVGRRRTHGASYEQLMPHDFPFAAIIEFDDMAGLSAYLQHPSHDAVGRMFGATLDAALVYDYEMTADLEAVRQEAAKA